MKTHLIIFKRVSFLVLFFIIMLTSLNAQKYSSNKNAIYLSYGNIIFEDQVSIAYERLIYKHEAYRTRLKAFLGKRLNNNYDYDEGAKLYEDYFGISGVQLIGRLELNAGLAYTNFRLHPGFMAAPSITNQTLRNDFIFYGSLGFRFEKDNFLFRAGINNLELLYVGLGATF